MYFSPVQQTENSEYSFGREFYRKVAEGNRVNFIYPLRNALDTRDRQLYSHIIMDPLLTNSPNYYLQRRYSMDKDRSSHKYNHQREILLPRRYRSNSMRPTMYSEALFNMFNSPKRDVQTEHVTRSFNLVSAAKEERLLSEFMPTFTGKNPVGNDFSDTMRMVAGASKGKTKLGRGTLDTILTETGAPSYHPAAQLEKSTMNRNILHRSETLLAPLQKLQKEQRLHGSFSYAAMSDKSRTTNRSLQKNLVEGAKELMVYQLIGSMGSLGVDYKMRKKMASYQVVMGGVREHPAYRTDPRGSFATVTKGDLKARLASLGRMEKSLQNLQIAAPAQKGFTHNPLEKEVFAGLGFASETAEHENAQNEEVRSHVLGQNTKALRANLALYTSFLPTNKQHLREQMLERKKLQKLASAYCRPSVIPDLYPWMDEETMDTERPAMDGDDDTPNDEPTDI